MSRPPEFDELIQGVDDPDERAQLQRVHQLLLAAEAPPELSFGLETPPPAAAHFWSRPRRRRVRPRLVLAAAVLLTTFGLGYLMGSPGGPSDAETRFARTITLESGGDAAGAIGIGKRDDNGNLPMILTVTGLERLYDGDYYRLALTKKGEPVVTCATFNVSGRRTTIRMTNAYNLEGFDGWVVTLWDAKTHDEEPVLSSNRI
ncbi:MAG: hypothetical protein H0V79_09030 [Actinobacteria bacterium]|nr:hypothetical protein [Actinomycetota bacterium]